MQNISVQDKVAIQKRCWIRLTKACNNRCVFCLDSEAQNGSFEKIKNINNNLSSARKQGIKRVVLSGGEPTLHPGFIQIVKFARDIGFTHIQVITNGRMFAYNDFLYSTVKNGVTEITFSMPGHNKELFETQTQIRGSFRQSLSGLRNALRISRLIVSVDIVISKYNYRDLVSVIGRYVNEGVREFDLLQVVPFGRAWKNRNRVLYDVKRAMPYLKMAFNIHKNPDIVIWTNRFPAKFLEGYESLIQHPIKLFDEIKGRRVIFDKFVHKNIKMSCFGKRCDYCFLRELCLDLITFKKNGILKSKSYPFCLRNNKVPYKHSRKKQIFFSNNSSIDNFCNFYINNRYFIKGSLCKTCTYRYRCSGLPIAYVRNYGFIGAKEVPSSK